MFFLTLTYFLLSRKYYRNVFPSTLKCSAILLITNADGSSLSQCSIKMRGAILRWHENQVQWTTPSTMNININQNTHSNIYYCVRIHNKLCYQTFSNVIRIFYWNNRMSPKYNSLTILIYTVDCFSLYIQLSGS